MGAFCSVKSGQTKQNNTYIGQTMTKNLDTNQDTEHRQVNAQHIIEEYIQQQQPQQVNKQVEQPIITTVLGRDPSIQHLQAWLPAEAGYGRVSKSDEEKAMEHQMQLMELSKTGKQGNGILETIQDCFNMLDKLIQQLGPAYTKLPKDDPNQ